MTDDTDTDTEETPEEPPATDEDAEEETPKPDVDPEATVDVDLDAVDDALTDDDPDDADDSEGADDVGAVDGDLSGKSMGDMYVKGVVATSNAIIERHDGEPIDEQVPRDLGLDDAMDEYLRSKGANEDLPPGQALVVGTSMFAFAVLASNPQIVEAVLDEVDL